MKKLEEIDHLVEEVMTELLEAPLASTQKRILTSLARKCAEINVEDWDSCTRTWIYDTIKTYNARLREGQVEEVHPAIQHINAEDKLSAETVGAINKLAEVAYNTPMKPALQPLPEEMPLAIRMLIGSEAIALDVWKWVIQHFGTPPREWWRDLKKGDKFVYDNGVDGKVRTFRGIIYLAAKEPEICDLSRCSPYTDPAQSFRSKLTPEMQVEFDKIVSSLTPNTPQP